MVNQKLAAGVVGGLFTGLLSGISLGLSLHEDDRNPLITIAAAVGTIIVHSLVGGALGFGISDKSSAALGGLIGAACGITTGVFGLFYLENYRVGYQIALFTSVVVGETAVGAAAGAGCSRIAAQCCDG